ncbi:MAG: membrane dipeptidase [Actinomycetota bacterium]
MAHVSLADAIPPGPSDVCRESSKPVFISHAGARALWDIPRMKPDDVIRAVAGTGGVIGRPRLTPR